MDHNNHIQVHPFPLQQKSASSFPVSQKDHSLLYKKGFQLWGLHLKSYWDKYRDSKMQLYNYIMTNQSLKI